MLAALSPVAYAPTVAPASVRTRAAVSMSFGDDFTVEARPWSSGEVSDAAGLEALAKKLNPSVGFFDPLNIGESSKETIGWYRHAEIKHGRVAMAAFVGYCVQSNGICFPWNLQAPLSGSPNLANLPTISFADISAAGGPADQWDALPSAAKLQILVFIGFLEVSPPLPPGRERERERPLPVVSAGDSWALIVVSAPVIGGDDCALDSPASALPPVSRLRHSLFTPPPVQMWSETSTVLKLDGEAHYVRGGKPGYFPKLSRKDDAAFPHPVPLNLWDPFGFTSKMSPERKEKALLAEINNGRLAQIGIIGMISASKGLQVPGLDSIAGIKPYAGEVMAPFATGDATLPFVADMLKSVGSYGW